MLSSTKNKNKGGIKLTNIIKVRFNKDGQPQGREYSYLSPIEVEVGDIVEMETRGGIAKGTVTQINVPEEEIEPFKDKIKSIIGKVKEETPEDEDKPRKEAELKIGDESIYTEEEAKTLVECLGILQNTRGVGSFPCPRCGYNRMKDPVAKNALSRRADVYICSECGQEEAILDAAGKDPLPLNRWDMVIALAKEMKGW